MKRSILSHTFSKNKGKIGRNWQVLIIVATLLLLIFGYYLLPIAPEQKCNSFCAKNSNDIGKYDGKDCYCRAAECPPDTEKLGCEDKYIKTDLFR